MTKWEFRFIVDLVHLPKEKVSVNEEITLERIDDRRARAFILLDIDDSKVRALGSEPAEQILMDFLSTYSVVTNLPTRIIQDEGGSQVSGARGFAEAVSGRVSVTVLPRLTEEDALKMLEQTKEIFQTYPRLEKSLLLAIRYYHHAMHTERIEDKVILYFIGLEALYMEERVELRYRLAQRLALMLGKSEDERKQVFRNVKVLYDKRGAIVHGSEQTLSREDINTLRDYLQKSILCFVRLKKHGKSKGQVLELLDRTWQSGKSVDELVLE